MTREYDEGQMVWMRIGERPPIQIKVLERTEDGRYFLDWGSCGFNSILNTVRVSANSLSAEPQK